MTRNLIPTPITDKNGKRTTVHKKAQPSPVAGESMPAPSLPMKKDLNEVRRTVEARIKELTGRNHDASLDSYLDKETQKYPERILNNIDLALRNNDQLAQCVAEDIASGEHHQLINETIHFYWKSGSTDYRRTALDVRTLTNYEPLRSHTELSTSDEHTQKQCLAIMRFTHLIDTPPHYPSPFIDYVNYDDDEMKFIKDKSLVGIILNRPDDVEQIAKVVLQYKTTNAAAINGIMEGALPAVAEGQL